MNSSLSLSTCLVSYAVKQVKCKESSTHLKQLKEVMQNDENGTKFCQMATLIGVLSMSVEIPPGPLMKIVVKKVYKYQFPVYQFLGKKQN